MKILLVDDHALFREGMVLLLRQIDPEVQALQAGSCEEALALIAAQGGADLALVDLWLPGVGGMDGLRALRDAAAEMLLVVMSSDDDAATVLQAVERGAVGFIPKSSTSQTMRHALAVVLDHGIYLPPSVIGGPKPEIARAVSVAAPATPGSLGLTPRQTDVLKLILLGQPAKRIARELAVAESTVKTHTSAVLRALNVTTRTQAVVAAARLGLRFDR